jgi:hypothetical protein
MHLGLPAIAGHDRPALGIHDVQPVHCRVASADVGSERAQQRSVLSPKRNWTMACPACGRKRGARSGFTHGIRSKFHVGKRKTDDYPSLTVLASRSLSNDVMSAVTASCALCGCPCITLPTSNPTRRLSKRVCGRNAGSAQPQQVWRFHDQSSSASRLTAGAAAFFEFATSPST